MAQTKRIHTSPTDASPRDKLPTANRYDAGGHIAELQANLARRLTDQHVARNMAPVAPAERAIRMLSVGSAYVALIAGYAAVGAIIVYCM